MFLIHRLIFKGLKCKLCLVKFTRQTSLTNSPSLPCPAVHWTRQVLVVSPKIWYLVVLRIWIMLCNACVIPNFNVSVFYLIIKSLKCYLVQTPLDTERDPRSLNVRHMWTTLSSEIRPSAMFNATQLFNQTKPLNPQPLNSYPKFEWLLSRTKNKEHIYPF